MRELNLKNVCSDWFALEGEALEGVTVSYQQNL